MKKVLLALCAVAALLAACTPKDVLPSSITLSKTAITLEEGGSFNLQAIVNPSDATNKELTWSSSADAVATVDQTGKVVAVKEGKATITATAKAASGVKGTCEVTVSAKAIPVTAVQLSESDPVTLAPEETLQLSAVITPSNATDNAVTWESDNTTVATVDANGKVTAVKGGVAYITAKVGGITSDALMVTVVEPQPMFVRYPYCLIRTGNSFKPQVWYGTGWTDRDKDNEPVVTWTSSDTAVASPEDGGVIRAIGPGVATITGTDVGGGKVSFEMHVEDRPDRQYDDYLPGISLLNCHDGSGGWECSNSEYALTDGYVEGTQCMGATGITGYKIANILFKKRVDVTSVPNPALFIRIYIDDISKFVTAVVGDEPFIELSAEEKIDVFSYDEHRLLWRLKDLFTNMDETEPSAKQTLHSGWNNIVLPFDRAVQNKFNDEYNASCLTQMRIIQMYPKGTIVQPTYVPMDVKIDQLRVVDWTEFERCDNFAMWRDRPAQQNQYCYVDDTQGKFEGRSCLTSKDVLMDGVSSLRLEMWPGLEYAVPAHYGYEDLALQFSFWVDDADFFTQYVNFNIEVGSGLLHDEQNIDFGIGGQDGLAWPTPLQSNQWVTVKFPFKDYEGFINEPWDIRKFNYFRIVLTPQGVSGALVNYHTFKLDDIRIVKR